MGPLTGVTKVDSRELRRDIPRIHLKILLSIPSAICRNGCVKCVGSRQMGRPFMSDSGDRLPVSCAALKGVGDEIY